VEGWANPELKPDMDSNRSIVESKVSSRESKVSSKVNNKERKNVVLYVKYPSKRQRVRVFPVSVVHAMAGHVGWERTKAYAEAVGIKLVGRDGTEESAREECMFCEPCMLAKASILPRFSANHLVKAERVGDMLHCDTQGPWRVMSREGRRYKFMVMDDHSAYALDFYLRHKNEFVSCLTKAIAFFERQSGNKVRIIVCDQEFTAPSEIREICRYNMERCCHR